MSETEQLEIVIDVLDQFTDEINRLLTELATIEAAAEKVEDITIDVDIRGEQQLNALMGQMAALQGMDFAGVGDVDVGGADFAAPAAGSSGGVIPLDGVAMGGGAAGASAMPEAAEETTEALHSLSSSADGAADGFRLTDLRMSDMHNAMAKLIPILATFIFALPAVIGAVGALAVAAGAAAVALASLAAFGALGFGLAQDPNNPLQGLTEAVDEIRDDFLDAFGGLARRLEPLFRDALDGLDRLFEAIASRQDSLMGLTDEARAFGQWVMDTLPSALEEMARFVDATSEALGIVGEALGGIDFFDILAYMLERTLPHIIVFGSRLQEMMGHLFGLSVGFLRVTNAVLMFVNVFLEIITVGGMFDEQVGIIVGSMLTLYSAILLTRGALVTTLLPALITVGKALFAVNASSLKAAAAQVYLKLTTLSLTSAVYALAGAVAVATAGLSVVAGVASIMGSKFGGLSTDIDSATSSLKEFRRESNRMDSGGRNPYRDPNVQRGDVTASGVNTGNQVTVNVEGDADRETVRSEMNKTLYKMERPRRSR